MVGSRLRGKVRRRRVAQTTVHQVHDRRVALLCGAGYLLTGLVAGRHEEKWEAASMVSLNRHGRIPAMRAPQQLGTPWVLPGIAAVAFVKGRPHLAAAAALALPVEKACEVGIKKVVRRRRPANSPRPTRLRDDAPADGPSYPSGHAAIAFAATALLAPYVDAPVVALAGTGGALVGLRRVQQGAHFPLDSVGGALLGVMVGSGLTWAMGRPTSAA